VTQVTDREYLLALLRGEPGIDLTAQDWERVTHLAGQHGVRVLLTRQLERLALTSQVPPQLLKEIRADTLKTAAENMSIYHEMGSLLERFQLVHIPGIFLKGAYLAEHIYGNLALRRMGDVDLLVRINDLQKAEEILLELDFRRAYHPPEPVKELHHFVYERAGSGLVVEIHWNLISQLYAIQVDMEGLWARSQATFVAGIPVREMAAEDQVLHLCVHASENAFLAGLRGMCDLTETLRHFQGSLDWELLQQRAQVWKAGRCLYVNLWLAKELLQAPVPQGWLNTLQPAGLEPRHLAIARERVFASVDETDEELSPLSKVGEVWAAGSLAHKLTLFWHSLFLPRREMALRYGLPLDSPRIALFYPLRLKYLLQKYSRVIWRLLRGEHIMNRRAERLEQARLLRSWLLSE
jgi:hypothetical protein